MAGFDNDTMYADNVDFSGSATPSPQVLLDGQLLIGATATPHIRVNTLTAGAGISITNGTGSITIAATGGITPVGGLVPDASTAPGTSPVVGDGSGNITVTGAQVASGVVGTNVIRTDSLAANTMTIEIQRSTAAAVSTPADNGVSHYDSSIFTVGANGFVSLVGGAVPPTQKFNVDANTGPGTDPVVADASGVVAITGAQVAAGVVGANVIRTDSLAANAYTIEVQRTTTAAATTLAANGVSHFDSAIFSADANGFVSLAGGSIPPAQKFDVDASTVPGTDPVVANASGVIVFSGAQVAAGTIATAIRTDSTAANSMLVEVQRTSAVAGSDVTKNGVSHFNSSQFSVDANGFVSSTVSPGGGSWQFIETKTAAASASLTFNTSISSYTELMFTFYNLTRSGGVGQIFFKVSSDNGSTTVTSTTSPGTAVPNSSDKLWFITPSSGTGNFSGWVKIQNVPGTTPKIAEGWNGIVGIGQNETYSVIPSGAVLNWVQFICDAGVIMTGDINLFGR